MNSNVTKFSRFQTCFHGVNLSAIQSCAVKEYFRQPIVDTFDIRICMSKSVRHVVDFSEADETDLHTIGIIDLLQNVGII